MKTTKICTKKDCSHLGIEQPIQNFCKDNSKTDGLASWCKTCHSEHSKQKIIKKNKNKLILPADKKICHKSGCIFDGKPQPITNFNSHSWCKDCRNKYDRERVLLNKENNKTNDTNLTYKICTNEFCSFKGQPQSIDNFYKDNSKPNGIKSWCKTCAKESVDWWNKNNLERKSEYQRNRYNSNIDIQINRCVSSNIYYSLKKSNGKNGFSWEELVDFTITELKEHLERLFLPNMTWDNYGDWEIDHIKPISSFNITSYDCDDFKKCWSLKNLQPLWLTDNRKKSNLINEKWNNI